MPGADFGVEWAPGRGALTPGLLNRWQYVLGIERDLSFCRELRRRFSPGRFGVVCGDILEVPLPLRPPPYPLVGNLPYHITGPLLIRILAVSDRISQFQGLVQWEVSQRLVAEPGGAQYRGITLLYRWMGRVDRRFRVPAEAFRPAPGVDSAWVVYEPERDPRDLEPMRVFVRRCFRHPRKTLVNNLADETEEKERWRSWMETRGWNPRRRPQTLTPKEMEEIYEQWRNERW